MILEGRVLEELEAGNWHSIQESPPEPKETLRSKYINIYLSECL